MASSSSNSSSFHVPRTKYDVFISFRGEDTRSSFLSHLVKALHHNQIDFYVDDDRLHPGHEISSTLLQAIEEAFISLVIFSKHYASSTWCMEELAKIIDCMERNQRIVIPVFYMVDPSDVRHQKRTFGEAFHIHEDKYKENMVKVKSWRSALKKAANLSGFHYPSKYQNESELIEKIVKDVSEKLSHMFSSESKGLVGIDKNFECIESLLAIESSEVQILGIWGMGGIGKTTIVEAVFEKYSSQYEGYCFLKNVREESQKYGLPYLNEKLAFELLDGENLLLKGPAKARSTNIKRRLSRKKVFIVLDDVNTLEQLEHLTRGELCLGLGSRVIITTRDKQLLRRVHGIYEVQGLNFKNSLQLFCLNAFGKVYPEIGYEKLSEMVVYYANGIPLALKVLGSFLYSRSIESWESALGKLNIHPNKDIFNVLKLSYDGLDDLERDIFLDIAFFFKGKDKDDVIRLLDSCGFFASIGIDNLLCKALITISHTNTIEMHDLIEQMGQEIVRQESINDPGKRSRLRNPEDVYNVLKNNRGTDLVKGIMLDLSQTRDLCLNPDTFKKMPYLRFLKLYTPCSWLQKSSNVYIPTALESFSDELRYLEWSGYPLKSLPSTFCAEKLVELRMPYSQVTKLWDGVQDLVNLKIIWLPDCKYLVELPDFTKASNLRRINLEYCKRLPCLHPSILSIHTLVSLNLAGCKKLKSFKGEIRLKSLKYVNLKDCSNLKELSISCKELIGLGRCCLRLKRLSNELCFLTSLEWLRLDGCKQLIELPHNINALSRLKSFTLRYCQSLRCLPELPPSIQSFNAIDCTSLRTIFSLKAALSLDLVRISFKNCMRLDEHSLYDIMEDAHRPLVRETIRNALYYPHPYGLSGCKVCCPGSKVPEWFKYQTREASITVELDQPYHHLLGFILCCVASRASSSCREQRSLRNNHKYVVYSIIKAQFRIRDGERDIYSNEAVCHTGEGWNGDHVFISYCHEVLEGFKICGAHCTTYNLKISFEFTVANIDDEAVPVLVKGCGILPIYVSDILNFIQKVEMEMELESDEQSKKYRDLDDLDLNAVKREMVLRMKEEPVPQSKIFHLASSSNCNNWEEE